MEDMDRPGGGASLARANVTRKSTCSPGSVPYWLTTTTFCGICDCNAAGIAKMATLKAGTPPTTAILVYPRATTPKRMRGNVRDRV